jgi:hypothetical protein
LVSVLLLFLFVCREVLDTDVSDCACRSQPHHHDAVCASVLLRPRFTCWQQLHHAMHPRSPAIRSPLRAILRAASGRHGATQIGHVHVRGKCTRRVRALNQTLPRRSASLSQCCACRRVGSPPQKATNFASRTLTHSPPATLVAGWNPTRAPPPPPPPPPPSTEDIVEADAPVRLASVPTSWYIDPYKQRCWAGLPCRVVWSSVVSEHVLLLAC